MTEISLKLDLAGRGADFTAFDQTLARAAGGRGQVLVLSGSRGSGKSCRLAAWRARAGDAGHTVLTAQGTHQETEAPFGVIRQLFESYLASMKPLARRQLFAGRASPAASLLEPDGSSRPLEPTPGDATSPGRTEPDFELLHGLFWLTANLAALNPLVLAVDDAHLTDPESLSYLQYLINRIDDIPITVLAMAIRPVLGVGDPLAYLERHAAARTVHLDPLDVSGVSGVVRATAWFPEAGNEFCQRCADACRGNPLGLERLLAGLRNRNSVFEDVTEPELIALAAETWAQGQAQDLQLLPAPAIALAQATAVLGDDSRLDWAGELGGLDPTTTATTAAATLAIAGILVLNDPITFVDPLIGEAIHRAMPPIPRGLLHARAARLLHRHGARPDTIASHLMQASPAGDEWSVDILRDAARRDIERGALESAATLLERALNEPPSTRQRAEVLVDLARVETRLGRTAAAETFEAAIELLSDRVERARNLGRLGRVRYVRGQHRLAARAFVQGQVLVSDQEPELGLQLEVGLMAARRFSVGARTATRERPIADDERRPLSPAEQGLVAQMAYDLALSPEGTADEAAGLAAAALGGDPSAPEVVDVDDTAFYVAVKTLLYADELDAAEAAVNRSVTDARRRESPVLSARNAHLRACITYRRGRITDTMGYAQESLDGADAGWLVVLPSAAAYLASCHLERGETKLAAAALELPGGDDRWSRTGPYDFYLYARAHLRVAEGRDADALDDLLQCATHAERMSAGKLSTNPWRSAAALVANRLGEPAQARAWVHEELSQARAFGAGRAIGVALGVVASLETGRGRLDLLGEAAEVLRASPALLELARVLVELGVERERRKGVGAGWESMQEGLDLAHRCGATVLAKHARSCLLQAGAQPRKPVRLGIEALSPGERRAADLASQGMTNLEISQELVITRKAVEWHLNRVFKKLGITSRRELGAALTQT